MPRNEIERGVNASCGFESPDFVKPEIAKEAWNPKDDPENDQDDAGVIELISQGRVFEIAFL